MTKEEAASFPGAMRHVKKHVYPIRKDNRREAYAANWWRFVEARPGLRDALDGLKRVLVVPRVTPRLIVARQSADICFDGQLMVVTLSSSYHFGVLNSRLHALWARARGSTLKGDLRYTNTTIFETFPFPLHPDGRYDPKTPPKTDAAARVAAMGEQFERLRADECRARQLGLTKLHNLLEAGELPALAHAYDDLNAAVCACYGFPKDSWRDEARALALLLELNARVAA